MTTNKKPAPGANRAGLSTADSRRHSTATADPLKGWFSLANNVTTSRKRQQKRGWQRGAKQ